MSPKPELETARERQLPSRRSPVRTLARNDLTMDTTVHDHSHETTGESPALPSENSDTRHWSDLLWETSPPAIGVANRLALIDRTLQGMSAINDLLRVDWVTRRRANDNEISEPNATLRPWQAEGLHTALIVLMDTAEESMQQLRDNTYNCWGAR